MVEASRIELLYADFQAQSASADAVDFATWCARHSDSAAELARLHSEFGRWSTIFSRLASGVATAPAAPPPLDNAELFARLRWSLARHERYTLGEEIGRGGMGAVFRVWDRELRRELAMKVRLSPAGQQAAPEPKSTGRFLAEAQTTAQLNHPGIVPVHELGLDSAGEVYFTMRLVKGEDLATVFAHVAAGRGGWTRTRALGVLIKVCEAMAYAHEKGVVHRDLKPANIMVGRHGEVYVMDWGLARVLGGPEEAAPRPDPARSLAVRTGLKDGGAAAALATMDGDIIGTPAYMPPEQARGDLAAIGPRADVYAVGAMLYQLLAIDRLDAPYVPRGAWLPSHAVLGMVLAGPPPALAELAPGASAELVAICEKAMARDPQARHRDMGELGDELRKWLEGRVDLQRASIFELTHLPPSLVFLYVGACVAMLGAWVATTVAWQALAAVPRAAFTTALVATLFLVGRVFWRRKEYRRSHAPVMAALLALPCALFALLHLSPFFGEVAVGDLRRELVLLDFDPLTRPAAAASDKPAAQLAAIAAERLDAKLLLVGAGCLVAAVALLRRTGAGLYAWFAVAFGLATWWLLAIQFGWRSLIDAHRIEVIFAAAIAAVAWGFAAERRGRTDTARPLLVLGFVVAAALWSSYADAAYPFAYFLAEPDREVRMWSYMLGGAVSLGIGCLAQRAGTRLLQAYSVIPYLLSPAAVLLSLSSLVAREMLLYEILLPCACFGFVVLAIVLQRKNLLYAGSFYLSVAVFQISSNHFEREWAWPLALAATGAGISAASFLLQRFDDSVVSARPS